MSDPEDLTAKRTEEARRLAGDFSSPSRRGFATPELAALGVHALPTIASILDGTACNEFGVPLRKASEEVAGCALISARLLRHLAAPLEPLLRAEVSAEHAWLRAEAAAALGALGSVADETIVALAGLLGEEDWTAAGEASSAISQLGVYEHPVVLAALQASPRARFNAGRFAGAERL